MLNSLLSCKSGNEEAPSLQNIYHVGYSIKKQPFLSDSSNVVAVATDWQNDPLTAMRDNGSTGLLLRKSTLLTAYSFGENERHTEILCHAGKKQ